MGVNCSKSETMKNKVNLTNLLLYSNANPIRLKDNLGYGCSFCMKRFQEPLNLKKHFLEEHNNDKLIKHETGNLFKHVIKVDITLLNCALCSKDFDNIENLIAHLKCHHNKLTYPDVKNQILPFRFNSEELCCAICATKFSTFKLLQEHMHSHYPNYICKICGAGFVIDKLRLSHEKRHGDGEYKCDQCDKVFCSEQNRVLHKKRTHLGMGKRNKCSLCNEAFSDYWKKINHMVKEHGMPPVVVKCQACDRTFNNRRALTNHTKKDHLLERKFKCDECDKSFFGRHALQEHMSKHSGLRKYRCNVCFKAYGRKNTLREHLRIHANDRRFACTHCDQAFVQKCSWRSHMRSRHGEQV